jgi:transcription antitermination factor NusG
MYPIRPADSLESCAQKGALAWFALQVRTRHETAIAGFLQAKGYEQFLPLYSVKKRWSDRVRVIEAPLFPGYLFCRLDPQYRLPVLKTPGVIQIVGYNRVPAPIEETEIHGIQTLVASGLPTQPWPFLAAGDPVQIESGSLRGLKGIVVKLKENSRLVVSITLLRRSVAVEIDSALVQPNCGAPTSCGEPKKEYRQGVGDNLWVPA